MPLNSGDRLHIGEYVISVTVVSDQLETEQASAFDADDWFDAPTEAETPSPVQAPPAQPAFEAAAPAPAEQDDWFDGIGSSDDDRELFTPDEPDVQGPDPFAPSQAPEQDFFVPPQAHGESQIPDDWDPMLSQITSAPQFRELAAEPAPQREAPAPPAPTQAPPPPARPPASSAPPAPSPAPPVRQAEPAPRVSPAPPPRSPAPAAAPGSGVKGGLGVDNLEVDPDTLAVEAGQALRVIVEGLMEILAGRAQVKDEFQVVANAYWAGDEQSA